MGVDDDDVVGAFAVEAEVTEDAVDVVDEFVTDDIIVVCGQCC